MVHQSDIEHRKKPDPLVSVSVITYNQKDFVAQTIQSVLDQKADFKYEVIVGDDFSTDGTRDVIIEYQKKYPDIVKPILHPKRNDGLPGKLNFLSTINAAKGKYIALLDGDDYWVDELKLQKQVDFLENNADYSICFHRVYELEKGKDPVFSTINNPDVETTYTISDLAKRNMIHAPSVVYRKDATGELPDWFLDSHVGDYVLHLLNAKNGKIKYFPKPMAVYRKNIGVWSGLSQIHMWEKWISVLDMLISHFKGHEIEAELKAHRDSILAAVFALSKHTEAAHAEILQSPQAVARLISGRNLIAALKYKIFNRFGQERK